MQRYKKIRFIKDIIRKCPGSYPLVLLFRLWKRIRWNLFRDFYRKRYTEKLIRNGNRKPVILYLETVNICSNDCIFCGYSKMNREKAIMPLATFEKALSDYSDMGGGPVSLTPIAGDVFFDDLLLERIKLSKKFKNITSIGFTTNAATSDRLSDNEMRWLVKNTDMMEISIYGLSEEEYNLITRRNDYSKVIKNIARIIKINTEAGEDGGRMSFGLRFLKNHNFKRIRSFMRNELNKNIGYDDFSSVYVTYGNWSGLIDTSTPLPLEAEWSKEKAQHTPCLIPMIGGQVLADGSVSLCHCVDYGKESGFYLGNINKNSLSDIYSCKIIEKLWDLNDDPGMPSACTGCTFYRPLSDLPSCEHIFEDPLDFVAG
jgi:MoaA/NifB/PqqE/SkfB family radical SAM enzyme